MSNTYVFDGWSATTYDDPRIGLVAPGDTREFDDAPPLDGHWTLVQEPEPEPEPVTVVKKTIKKEPDASPVDEESKGEA